MNIETAIGAVGGIVYMLIGIVMILSIERAHKAHGISAVTSAMAILFWPMTALMYLVMRVTL